MSPSCSFMSASFLSAVLLLQLTLVPVRCSVVEKHQMQSNCSNEGRRLFYNAASSDADQYVHVYRLVYDQLSETFVHA